MLVLCKKGHVQNSPWNVVICKLVTCELGARGFCDLYGCLGHPLVDGIAIVTLPPFLQKKIKKEKFRLILF